MYEFNLKNYNLVSLPNMFCQSNFRTNKIFVFLNASIDRVKKIAATETTVV